MAQTKLTYQPNVLAADTLTGDKVVNHQKEDLGKIEHLMIDLANGRIAYAVLSFGGFLGMGDKLFAIPWSALKVDTVEKQLALRENSEKRPIGGDLSVLPFLGWLASGFQPGAADLGQLPAESIAVSESLESWNSRIVRG